MSRTEKTQGECMRGTSDARRTSKGSGAWYGCWAASLIALLPGCLAAGEYDETQEDDAEIETVEFETLEQPINGGTLSNGAFPAVVKLLTVEGACTATKVSDFRFLTAGHCVDRDTAARQVDIVGVDGVQRSLDIPTGGIQMHPSWALIEAERIGIGADAADSYDVAVITTTTATSTLPALRPLSTTIRQATVATGVGYGCDSSDATRPIADRHEGVQQFARFDLTLLNNSHQMTDLGTPSMCEGDSGGPGLNADNRIIGVMGQGATNQSFFQRVSNVTAWINNPVPGNDPTLLAVNQSAYFMHRRPATPGLLGLCMAASASSGTDLPVQLSECSDNVGTLTGGRGPLWTFIQSSTSNRFVLINSPTSRCLAVPNGAANANLRLETCANGFTNDRQKWFFITTPNPSGFRVLRIKNHSSGLCIRTENNSTAHGTLIEQTPCDAGTSLEVGTGQSWVAMRQ